MKTYVVVLSPISGEGWCLNYRLNVDSRKEAILEGRNLAKNEPGYRFTFVHLQK